MDHYIEKVQKFNQKDNYLLDIQTGKLLINYCISSKQKILYVIGTGLGEDIEIIRNLRNVKIIGIEPRTTFQKFAEKKYSKFWKIACWWRSCFMQSRTCLIYPGKDLTDYAVQS